MEDGVSAILYIIISAIIILIGVLGKKKKPQQIPGGSGNGELEGMDFFEKLGLKDIDEDKEEYIDVEEEVEETKKAGDSELHEISITPTFSDQSEKMGEAEEKIFEEETEKENAYSILSDEVDYDINEIKEEFDLKKAIIYSEIINRKYE
jgi:hypothetical protein